MRSAFSKATALGRDAHAPATQYSDICVTTQTEGFLKTGGYSAQQANNWARGNWRPLYNVNYYLKHMKDAAPYVDDADDEHYEGVGRFWRAWF